VFGRERSRGLNISPLRSSRDWVAETAYLKRADDLVPFPLVCQLAKNRDYAH
jgi:hypothetical protein